jgi:hypothetical protein
MQIQKEKDEEEYGEDEEEEYAAAQDLEENALKAHRPEPPPVREEADHRLPQDGYQEEDGQRYQNQFLSFHIVRPGISYPASVLRIACPVKAGTQLRVGTDAVSNAETGENGCLQKEARS